MMMRMPPVRRAVPSPSSMAVVVMFGCDTVTPRLNAGVWVGAGGFLVCGLGWVAVGDGVVV